MYDRIRISYTVNSNFKLLLMFARSSVTLSNKKGWLALLGSTRYKQFVARKGCIH